MKIGILGFQGCIEPHEAIFAKLGISTIRIRAVEELDSIAGLILPGGESTTMLRLLAQYELQAPIQDFSKKRPIWGICAGAILIAREVVHPEQGSLNLIDIRAHRNYYGSQLDSFCKPVNVSFLDEPLDTHFIRAPLLEEMPTATGREKIKVLGIVDEQPIFFQQGHVWACSCHFELGEDFGVHQKFIEMSKFVSKA